ncbi:MAG: cell wall-binding repeat-containing protein [Desulfitobacteriaceae bacterium]|nr:cell wall-binding repeat-containing protein [Desulfitobacteriaceae bacterium]MDI6880210.1 cell wall-binding repeat-containing protein [Desulfitobacteriaceae bacterium]MDI6912717.1 cell wall-binding repeat-containing protein [Desulfitobacteriaceae bacterium]
MIGETRKRNKGNGAGLGVRGMLAILLSLSLLAVPLGSAGSVSAAEMGSRYAASASGVAAAERLGGSDRYATAVQISQAGWPGTSNAAILTAGADANLVDALTAAPLAYQLNAPILFTEGATLTPATETELKRLQVKTVYVANGSEVILDSVRDRLQSLGLTVKSLGGTDRYATAVNIAKELETQGVAVNQVALTTGLNQADALSIAPVAAGKGMPILLTAPEQLPAVVQEYLAAKQAIVNKSYVIGGTGAVSETVAAALSGSVTRLGGTDRYATNRQVVQNFLGSFQNRLAYLANGQDGSMADALAGAPLAAKNGAPVFLTSGSADAVTQEFALKNLPSQVVALGGTGVVPGGVLSPLRAVQVLSEEGATLGANDPAQPVTFEDNLVLSGAKMTLANATVTHSLTVQGDQTKLSQVKVLGTLYLDPGANGSVNLSQVEAGRIVVLSGADHSLIFEDVISQLLQVISSSLVHVVSQGVTQISNTMVSSNAILDAPSGNLGQVEVARSLGVAATPANPGAPGNAGNPAGEIVGLAAPSVELRGVFTQTIVVSTEATVKAATGASVAQLTVAPERSAQHISLQGTIQALNIDRQAEVALAANTQVKNTVVNAAAILDATAGSFGQVTLSAKIGSPNSNPNPNGTPTPGSGAATLQVVELRGNFTQTIAVSGQVQVKAAKEANVAKLQVAPEQSGQRVVLDGEFVNLEVNKEVKIELKDQAKVHEAVTNTKVDFEIPKGAEVGKLDPKGMGTTATGGGNVNGTATSEDTNAPPGSSVAGPRLFVDVLNMGLDRVLR